MKTAGELLIEQIKSKADSLSTSTKEERIVKGIYVDCLCMAREAKELEKEQLKECWRKAQEEQRKEFSSSYSSIKFEEWFKNYKNDDKGV